tara:strand:- start:74 stop:478 length:405 start_codon:yes stop_codon:yes gene_type:complete
MTKKNTKSNRIKNKSELDNLTLADGKVNKEDPDIAKIKAIEAALGMEKANPFGTTSLEIFKEKLSEMTNVDLQHMCEKVGIFASGSRQDIKSKLLREFKSTNKGSISLMQENPSIQLDPNNPDHQKALKILGEI